LSGAPSDANHKWIGKLDALLAAGDDVANLAELRTNANIIQAHTPMEASRAAQGITGVLYRALAAAELRAPVSAKGSFILAGNAFDAMAAIGKVLEAAKRLLADEKDHKPTLRPAQQRWLTQYGASRPVEVRLAAHRILHDRLIIVDDTDTRVLTQSLNSFAARSPASIVRVDDETSALKIAAYAAIWAASSPL